MSSKIESVVDPDPTVLDIESCSSFSLAAVTHSFATAPPPPETHNKVPLPKSKRTLAAFRDWAGECFFPDDPLHHFKKRKSFCGKLVLALQNLFPIILWGSDYNLNLLKSDFISGVTIASLAIPQGISYANIANLPPTMGLYSSFLPPMIYLVMGSSMDLAVGPSSIVSVVLGSMLSEAVSPETDPSLYLQLALTSTFIAGLFQASLGFLRLGFLVEFLSKPTLMGFTGGAAVITILQQLKGLTGAVHFTKKTGIVPVMASFLGHVNEWNWRTILVGFAFLLFLQTAKSISKKRPNLFLIAATAPLISVIISTIILFCLKSQNHGIQTVGPLKRGLNHPSANLLLLGGPYFTLSLKTGFITGILSLAEGIAVGRAFGSMKSYQIDGNKEMTALGMMNVVGSFASCFITTGSFSRSAVNYNSGCKTAISNLVMALVVLITMMFLMPLFYYTPNVVLSVIVIVSVIGLINFGVAMRLWKVDKLDFLAHVCAFLGVLFISVPIGLGIAVCISIFKILVSVARPNIVDIGNVLGTQSFRSLEQYKEAVRIPSFLILRIEFPIYFASSIYLQDRILRWVREEEERTIKMKESGIKFIILDLSAVTQIDTSGIDALLELQKTLNKKSLQLVLANPNGDMTNKLYVSEAWKEFGSDCIYMSVSEAVSAVTCMAKTQT
ncbi:putative sulfate transporter 3.4 [Apostasia shenzhenica]|uniref:Putative sulfate transporter 3.4 n=1 Tax=Apostasia shenzhenica TaxID=1088818 RepID=A0A2H9ZU34_9ASPA|nr:putative sulfate transporter 3.4 [Apostasia shenzhenica]